MNGKSNLVDIYITKRDLLEIVKEKYRDQFEELSSITKDDNEKYVFQFQVDSYVLNFPKDFVLSEKNLTLYMFFYDCLPELLKQHKAIVVNAKNHKIIKHYTYKTDRISDNFYLDDGTLFYSTSTGIIWEFDNIYGKSGNRLR
jgi:hypothetical protein